MEILVEITKIVGTAMMPILAIYLFVKYGKHVQLGEAEKANAMADAAYLYSAKAGVHSAGNGKFIDLEVSLTNTSNRKIMILAIFVSYKPIIATSQPLQSPFPEFNKLPDFELEGNLAHLGHLNLTKNIAYLPDSLWQTGINGTSIRHTFELLPDEFCEKFPLILAEIKVYSSSTPLLDKTHFPSYHIGDLRSPWCTFLKTRNIEGYDFFGRVAAVVEDCDGQELKHGERKLILQDQRTDVHNTITFQPILRSTISYTIPVVIDFKKT